MMDVMSSVMVDLVMTVMNVVYPDHCNLSGFLPSEILSTDKQPVGR